MKKAIFILSLISILIFIFSTMAIGAEDKQNGIKIYPLKYSLENEAIKIDAVIPVIRGLGNSSVEEEFNLKVRDNVLNFTEDIQKQAEKLLADIKEMNNRPFFKFQAMVVLDVKDRGDILSMMLTYYQYTDGAHGLTTLVSHNLDIRSGKEVSFSEFLARHNLDITAVKEGIEKEIKENPGDYFPEALDYIREKNEFDYYLEDNTLIIYFQQYDLAPYAAGNPKFRIPLN